MRVEVANPKDRVVNLGALRVGQVIKRSIPVVNNSPASLSFNVVITPLSSVLQQLPHVLTLSPTQEIHLKAKGGSRNLDVVFNPKCRIPQFTEEVSSNPLRYYVRTKIFVVVCFVLFLFCLFVFCFVLFCFVF